MAEENNILEQESVQQETVAAEEVTAADAKVVSKTDKKAKPSKKVSFGEKLKNFWSKVKKFARDTVNEMKKVHWTPKEEVKKNTILVVVIVLVVATALALVDVFFEHVFVKLNELINVYGA